MFASFVVVIVTVNLVVIVGIRGQRTQGENGPAQCAEPLNLKMLKSISTWLCQKPWKGGDGPKKLLPDFIIKEEA